MPWLTVTGTGNWGFGRPTGHAKTRPDGTPVLDHRGQTVPEVAMISFPAGLHEVDEETAERARASGIVTLIVTETPPTIIKRDPHGPLSWEDIRLPADGGFYIADEGAGIEVVEDVTGPPLDWPCPGCPRKFPSSAARDRHAEFEHAPPGTAPVD